MFKINEGNFLLISSDIHNNEDVFQNLAKVAEQQNCLAFLYAGDLNIENIIINATLRSRNFLFIPVQGNCDNKWDAIDVGLDLPLYRTCSFQGLKIFLTHGHMYYDPDSAGLSNNDFDIVINGHSHVNSIRKETLKLKENSKEIIYLNPGSPTWPRGRSKASYALIIFKENKSVSVQIRDLSGDSLLSEETITLH